MSGKLIDEYIGEQIRRGTWDSSGEFTVGPLDLWEMADKHRLPRFRYCLAQAIRAALALGAEKVALQLERWKSSLWFKGVGYTPRRLKTLLDLRAAFSAEDSDLLMNPLGLSVLSMLACSYRRIELKTCSQGRGGRVVWLDKRQLYYDSPLDGNGDTAEHTGLSVYHGLMHAFNGVAGDCIRFVELSCGWSPIPIFLNGQVVRMRDFSAWIAKVCSYPNKRKTRNLIERYHPNCEGEMVAPSTTRAYIPPRVDAELLSFDPAGIRCSSVMALVPFRYGNECKNGFVYVVRDGVVVCEIEVFFSIPGFVAVVEAGDLTFDVTGMRVRQDARLEELLAWLQKEAVSLHNELEDRREALPSELLSSYRKDVSWWREVVDKRLQRDDLSYPQVEKIRLLLE